MNNLRSQVLTLAHKMKSEICSFGEAQKKAWKAIKAKQDLRKAVCILVFKKVNGDTSTKLATLKAEFLPEPKAARTDLPARKRTSAKITFWSIDDNGFRSFLPENLISIASIPSESRILEAA